MAAPEPRPGAGLVLVFRADSGDLFTVNPTGAYVWRLRARGLTADQIVGRLAARYRLSLEGARQDVFAFLADVRRHGLEIA